MFKKIFSILAIFVLCFTMTIGSVYAAEISTMSDSDINRINDYFNELGIPDLPLSSSDSIYDIYISKVAGSNSSFYVYLFKRYSGSYVESFNRYVQKDGNGNLILKATSNNVYFTFTYYIYSSDGKINVPQDKWYTEQNYNRYTDNLSHTMPSSCSVVYSTFDILNQDGSVFFQAPKLTLAEVVQGATKEALPHRLQDPTVGTMRVLVLCGVGLIALLMGLNLFGKVLPRFLNRS